NCSSRLATTIRIWRDVNLEGWAKRCGLTGPQPPVQTPILNRLAQVLGLDLRARVQVGDGARHAQDSIVGPGGEAEVFHGALQKALGITFQRAKAPQLSRAHAAVERRGAGAKALRLDRPRPINQLTH